MSEAAPIHHGQVLTGPLFSEPMRVETVRANSAGSWIAGLVGTQTERIRSVGLTADDIAGLTITGSDLSYDADGRLLWLGLEAHALGIAHELDPCFGRSISRVDPLPHQLEAVYEHLLKLSTVRFLLADDAGAGKTIMAGLLVRELMLRGLAERILVICPANLTFQWQREFREKFDDNGNRIGGARMTAAATLRPNQTGRHCRLPSDADYAAVHKAQARVAAILEKWEHGGRQGLSPIPDEPTPVGDGSGVGRAFSVQRHGMFQWGDLFTARQKAALVELSAQLRLASPSIRQIGSMALSRLADKTVEAATQLGAASSPRN
ncbi:MAG: DEAD/DEAH box helicase [Boseongicola sp. SB0662_bin_57]|nr:DEAD/DEAH box helicase [Boseongicola sp. SB0662_bin_57]